MQRLQDKVAFLTGAGSGIAKATAIAFAKEGAKVAVIEINRDAGRKAEQAVREFSDDVIFIETDVTHDESVKHAIDSTVERFGKLDVMFNCAGGSESGDGLVHEMSLDVWQRTILLNLLHPFLCCRHGIPHMLQQGRGSIINVSSHVSLIGSVRPIYAAAKGGINSFTRTLAAQYSRHGLRANAIACGTVLSERLIEQRETEDRRLAGKPNPAAAERNALKTLYPFSIGGPSEIASVAVFLASDEASMVNGATMAADGGRSSYLKVSV
ncbi:SDR family NAD(P)-dependent oxidoreductase [Paraburkholderia sp. RL17-347-BIC-D]|uniref:SDR family NAD(P)-dependent oxidoreductase n=1 Tax=Paraburkholderia sp. RL17-347-BIC-D TaxID=3031632 RepID=UPI0038B7FE01